MDVDALDFSEDETLHSVKFRCITSGLERSSEAIFGWDPSALNRGNRKKARLRMRTTSISKVLVMALALSGPALLPVLAAQPEAGLATMTPAGASVLWDTASNAPQLVLSVTGPGVAIRQVSEGGGGLGLSLAGDDGGSLPDGTYNWEIRESFPGLNEGVYDPANGRDAVDAVSATQRIEVEGRVQSGVFTLLNGSVVDSTLVEDTSPEVGAATDRENQ